MRALIVEDDQRIAAFVAKGLREEGYATDVVHDGDAGFDALLGGVYDVAIVDVMLPRRDGVQVVKDARSGGVRTPILILSARDAVEDPLRVCTYLQCAVIRLHDEHDPQSARATIAPL